MSVFTPKRIERGESWLPLPVYSDQDDLSIPTSSGKSRSPESDVPSTKSLGDELKNEVDGRVLPIRRHSEMAMSPRLTRAVSIDPKLHSILNMSADEIAEQLTLIDLALLKNIHLSEFEHCRWTKKEKRTLAPNIVHFSQRFNHTSFWVVRDILNEVVAKNRAELIVQFIKITRRLLELNNLHSLAAIVGALSSHPIQRLSHTWKYISRRDRSTFEKMLELVSDSDNYSQLRARMSPLQLPCIPYLGLFLKDLVYLDSLPSTSGSDNSQKVGDILAKITSCKQSHYEKLSAAPSVQKYLLSVRYIEELQKFYEDDNYKLSLQREPDPSLSQAMNSPRAAPSNCIYIHPPRISKSQENLLTPLKPVSAGPTHLVGTPPREPVDTDPSSNSGTSSDIPILQVTSDVGRRSSSPRQKGSTLPTKIQPDVKGTLSCSVVADKPHASSPKPFKKRKGHYKSMSLGSNVLAVLGATGKPEGRVATPEIPPFPVSLLDDSLLDNCVGTKSSTASEYYSPYTPPLSTTSSAEVNSDEEGEVFLTGESIEEDDDVSWDEGDRVLKEGKLKRKVLKRRGSSVTFKIPTMHLVQLTPLALLYTSPKNRFSKGKKIKGISLEGIKIHYSEPVLQLKEKQFLVVDKNGTQLKFTASSATEAESWAESIRDAGEQFARKKAEEKPLIKL